MSSNTRRKASVIDRSEFTEAPLKISLEVWPEQMKARGALTKNGKTQDIEIKSTILSLILGYLNV